MGVVHSLESDAGVIAVEVAVLYEVFDGVDDLVAALNICSRSGSKIAYLLEQVGLLQPCFKHCSTSSALKTIDLCN